MWLATLLVVAYTGGMCFSPSAVIFRLDVACWVWDLCCPLRNPHVPTYTLGAAPLQFLPRALAAYCMYS
jgi:hypothetical protein